MLLNGKLYELHGIDDMRDTSVISQYFVLLQYTAVYRDPGDTGIVTYLLTISIEVSWVSHNSNYYYNRFTVLCLGLPG